MDEPTLVIVSGYFSPLHCGHLDYIEAGAAAGDKLAVIVNNNAQQVLKKGKLILDEQDRLRIVKALRVVDEAMISIDTDSAVSASIEAIAQRHPDHRIVFGNGGDRNPDADMPPEGEVCARYGIEMVFDLGGNEKRDSSSRINQELGVESSD
ncbi:MAG: adenylyltransferase/cytidyltransferase family protein [Actinomycetota bacterium]